MIVLMWLTHAPLKVAAMLLAWLVAPLAARASLLTDNHDLPRRLGWMLTTDNTIDALWQHPEHLASYSKFDGIPPETFAASRWLRQIARRMWLQRNPAAGLSYQLGIPKANLTRHDKLQRGQWDSGASNLAIRYWTRDGRAVAWQIQAQWFYRKGGSRFLRLNLGWKDSGNRDRLIHVMHINPFRTWSR